MAASVLSSAYAVFVVRERESRSKHVQLVSGAPLSAFWAANYAWDMATFCVPAACAPSTIYLFFDHACNQNNDKMMISKDIQVSPCPRSGPSSVYMILR
jgi:hypothetical protein